MTQPHNSNSKSKKYYSYGLILLFGLLIHYLVTYLIYSESEDYSSTECKAEQGCLNDTLFQAFKDSCKNGKCEEGKTLTLDKLAKLANVEYDQAIYTRRFQHDFSKSCGALKINRKQRHLFAEECSYLVFSKGKEMTGYARGNCFSSSYILEHLENNFWFDSIANQHIDYQPYTVDNISYMAKKKAPPLLNQRIYNQPIAVSMLSKNGLSILLSKDNSPNSPSEDKNIKCFSYFAYQSA